MMEEPSRLVRIAMVKFVLLVLTVQHGMCASNSSSSLLVTPISFAASEFWYVGVNIHHPSLIMVCQCF